MSETRGKSKADILKIVSLHWGFGYGGVAKYAALLDETMESGEVEIHNICILTNSKIVDNNTLNSLRFLHTINISMIANFMWVRKLAVVVNSVNPDAIMTHGFNGHFAAWFVRHFISSRVEYIASYHGGYYGSTYTKKLLGHIYEKFTHYYLKSYASKIVSVANVSRMFLVENGVDLGKISVVHNGIPDVHVDSKLCSQYNDKLCLPDNAYIIGAVSRFEPIKGIDVLVNAFASIAKKYPDVYLVLVGSGVQEKEIISLVETLGIVDRVVFFGYQTDIPEIINIFDLYVLPSKMEAHSIALLEAMRAAKPIVATDAGGNTESVEDGKEAIIARSGDVRSLSDGLITVLESPQESLMMAARARQRFLYEFTEESMIRNTYNWLTNSISIKT